MNGVLGMTSLLLETPLTEQQRHYAETGHESAQALLTIINDILDLSKLEAGKVELENLPYSIEKLVAGVATLLSERASSKGVLLQVEETRDIPPLLQGDPTRLKQVLFNLVGNAIKFTEQGQVTVRTVYSKSQEGQPARLRFEVVDSGIGISEEQQSLLFDRFTQADNSITRKFGGTGLGLSICRQLVELMGGQIGVHSVLGKGSTFWFEVPAELSMKDIVEGTENLTGQKVADVVTKQKVLVAEDNEINQMLIRALLEKYDHSVRIVSNGVEALAAIEADDFDVVLMDIQMPVMDGISCAQEIRKLEGDKGRIPIIALTANAMSGQKEEYLASGMNGYVSKPIDQHKLIVEMMTVTANRTRVLPDKVEEIMLPDEAMVDNQTEIIAKKRTMADQEQQKALKDLAASFEDLI
ncbi:MAG: hypothetical protein CMF31_08810 [Kordiimonas sp.]|nr:hypothetical protein [Kordiimonas sp.]|tara:strand:+ start:474 stop:1709 length:1236 start_codon:yes stop_codon:yes gene_type:complete